MQSNSLLVPASEILVALMGDLYDTNLLKKLGLAVNQTHKLIICCGCKIVISPCQVPIHCDKTHGISTTNQDITLFNLICTDNRIHNTALDKPTAPISVIQGLVTSKAYVCSFAPDCSYLSPKKNSMDHHHRTNHKGQPKSPFGSWKMVLAQQYNSIANTSYFRVFEIEVEEREISALSTAEIILGLQEQMDQEQQDLITKEDIRNVTPWLRNTRWHEHFHGYNAEELCALVSQPSESEFPGLQEAVEHLFARSTDLFDKTEALVLDGITNTPFHRLQYHEHGLRSYLVPTVQLLAMLLRPKGAYEIDLPLDIQEKIFRLREDLRTHSTLNAAKTIFDLLTKLWTRKWLRLREAIIVDPTIHYLALCSVQKNGSYHSAKILTNVIARLEYSMRLIFMLLMHEMGDPNETCQQLQTWFIEKQESTFNSLRHFQHMASTVSYGTTNMPRIFWTDNERHRSMLYRGHPIHFDKFPSMFTDIEQEMQELWEKSIICGLQLQVKYEGITEDLSDNTPGYSFMSDPRNITLHHKTLLIDSILQNKDLYNRFIVAQSPLNIIWNVKELRKWLCSYAELQLLHACRFLTTAGSPSRTTELTAMLRTNTVAHPTRNLLMFNRHVTLVCTYQKTSALMGNDRCIPHALDGFGSDLMIQDLAIARPFAELAAHVCYSASAVRLYRTHVFINQDRLFTTTEVTEKLEQITLKNLGFGLGSASWRQVSIAFRRKICPRLYELIEEDEMDSIQSLQSGHSRSTENRNYGISADSMAGAAEDLLPKFIDASTDWQVACKVVPGGLLLPYQQARTSEFEDLVRKGLVDIPRSKAEMADARMINTIRNVISEQMKQEVSKILLALQGRPDITLSQPQAMQLISPPHSQDQQVYPPPALGMGKANNLISPTTANEYSEPADVEKKALAALRKILGKSDATWSCPEQRDAVLAALNLKQDILPIMATGSGKTMIALIPAMIEHNLMTVLILPLNSLMIDYERRLQSMNFPYEIFEGRRIRGQANLLLVSADTTKHESWIEHSAELNYRKQIVRQIVDEAHIPLQDAEFRPALRNMYFLRILQTQMIVMSGTVPLAAETHIKSLFGLSPDVLIYRSNTTNRPELKYVWMPRTTEQELESKVVSALENYKSTDPLDRVLIYVPTYDAGERLSDCLEAQFYHSRGELEKHEQKTIVDTWISGDKQIMVSTAAFGAGNDYSHTRLVIHAGTPREMINYVQEATRAGRDKLPATCVMLPVNIRKPILKKGDLDFGGKVAMHNGLSGPTTCIRYLITNFTDVAGTYCKDNHSNQQCSVCEQASKFFKRSLTESFQETTEISKKRKIEHESSGQEYILDFKKQLRKFERKCVFCLLHGITSEHHSILKCDTLQRIENGKGTGMYLDWRKTLRYIKPQKICFRCHVPQGENDALHRKFIAGSPAACEYPDLIAPMAFAIFTHPASRNAARVEYGWNFDTFLGFATWLNGEPVDRYESNLTALFLWWARTEY